MPLSQAVIASVDNISRCVSSNRVLLMFSAAFSIYYYYSGKENMGAYLSHAK